MGSLAKFPQDILIQIAECLDGVDLAKLSSVSSAFHQVVSTNKCWAGSVRKSVYSGQESYCRELVKRSYFVWRSICDNSWGDDVCRMMSLADQKRNVSAVAKELNVVFGSLPPMSALADSEAVVVVANTQRLLVVGANASPVRWFFPPASRFHYQVAGCMFSPHEALRLLAFACDKYSSAREAKALLGSLHQIFFDCRAPDPKDLKNRRPHFYRSIAHRCSTPNHTVISVLGMKEHDLVNMRHILAASHRVDVLDISHFKGSDYDIVSILASQRNLITLVAADTQIGSACFGVLGISRVFPGTMLEHLDIQGCNLRKGACSLLLSCLTMLTSLKALVLSRTEAGDLFLDAESSGMGSILQNLSLLDVSHMPNLTASGLANILALSSNLEELYCHDCAQIEKLGGEKAILDHLCELAPTAERAGKSSEWLSRLPSLRSASFGWGFGHKLQRAVWRTSPWLVSFRSSIGSCMSDCALAHLAASCCNLQCLALESCPVTSQGVAQVLKKCARLHTLRLLRCTGPFGDELGAALPGCCGLRELCILWGARDLSDAGVRRLVGTKHSSLHRLELVGCRNLSNSLLKQVLEYHANSLRVLRLEECQPFSVGGSALSSTELEALVCGAKALKVLRIRHVCPLDSGFAERIARACSTLEELVLDKCDFKMGIESVGMQPFAKLRFIQVVHCTAEKSLIQSPLSTDEDVTILGHRTRSKGVMVYDLLTSIPVFLPS